MSLKALSPIVLLLAAGSAFIAYQDGWGSGAGENGRPAGGSIRPAGSGLAIGTLSVTDSPAGQPPAAGRRVDESAIYYYASQGDWARMRAEIERLKTLYPDWVPPANPEAGPVTSDPDLQRMWSLFSESRYPEVRDAIAARRQRDPAWIPPADLAAKLDQAEARTRLINAADAGQWTTVLQAATGQPDMLVCSNVEVLWRVAEAFVRTDQPGRGEDVFKYILANCRDGAERAATAEKVAALLPHQDAERLLAQHAGEAFDGARDTLVRRRVGDAAQHAETTASAADLARMEELVAGDEVTPEDALLLAFYLYAHGQPARAAPLFKIALDRGAGSEAAEGYVLALGALGQYGEAEPIAYEWHDKAPDNLKAYFDTMIALLSQDPPPHLEAAVIQRFVPVVSREKSSEAGQALGWYAYNTGQVATAELWFIQALRWDRETEPAAYGLAVARGRLKNRSGFLAVVNAWRDRSQRIADLVDRPGRRQAPAGAVAARRTDADDRELFGDASRPGSAVAAADRDLPGRELTRESGRGSGRDTGLPAARRCASSSSLHGVSRLSGASALSLGWCLMTLNRPMEAVRAFDAVRDSTGDDRLRREAAYGRSLAYLRAGLTNEAALAASETRIPPRQKRELTAALLSQQASAAFNDGRYAEALFTLDARSSHAPEQTDLMLLRGWSHFHLGQFTEAERVFRALQRTGTSPDAAKGLNAIAERLNRIRY